MTLSIQILNKHQVLDIYLILITFEYTITKYKSINKEKIKLLDFFFFPIFMGFH